MLNRAGHSVTVVDRQAGPGRETSFANGALLTPSMSEPWNTPGWWRTLLASLGRSNSPLQLSLNALPGLGAWGLGFLRNSSPSRFEHNTLLNLRLALYSREVMGRLREETGIDYSRSALGTLRVFRDSAALDQALAGLGHLSSQGVSVRRLSREATVALEPALAPIEVQLAGAIHSDVDESGDAHRFCIELGDVARRHGVAFRYGVDITRLDVENGLVTAAIGERDRIVADNYVVAAGSYSTRLLRTIGLCLPVRPVKGYSVTFDDPEGRCALRVPVVDDHLHAVVVPLEGAIRVAGTAEFAGYDLSLRQARVDNLVGLLRQVFPEAQLDPASAKAWCGLRAMSADGVPIIGPTAVPNLAVNTGHGHLGWTMAAGSAQLLADVLSETPASVDLTGYAPARFARSR